MEDTKMPEYKICILAAGKGARMENLAKDLHKGLLPLNNKPILSHIIDSFPKNIEIVMAVGHKKELVKQYLSVAHLERKKSWAVRGDPYRKLPAYY